MQKNNKLPKISIVTCCYNADLKIFKMSLDALEKQDYPKNKIEHIVMDGGSTNGAVEFARTYGCKVFSKPELLNRSLARMSIGIQKAKGDIILFLEPDNIMVGNKWLQEMVKPFQDKDIIGTFSKYNFAKKNMPALTRYSALIGANDPTLIYLGKSEKLMRFQKKYNLGITIYSNQEFTKVKFTKKDLPTLGDNGHMVRRKEIQSINKDPFKFLHTDAFLKLIEKGYNYFGVVNNEIIHHTGSSIIDYFRKRVRYKKLFYENKSYHQKYKVFDFNSKNDRRKIFLFILYTFTFIQPLYISIRGFLSYRDAAWFLHPLMCIMTVISYGFSEIKSKL